MLSVVPVLLGISIVVFGLLHLIPGDPAVIMCGIEASAEVVEHTRIQLGLDKPLPTQFMIFLTNAVRGDLGTSIRTGRPVVREIVDRYSNTIRLALGSTFFAAVLGMASGITAAVKQNSLWDNVVMVITLIAVSTPSYWLSLMLMLVFSLYLGWFPSFGADTLRHFVMPVFALGAQSAGIIARMTRSSMLEVLRQDYMVTARSKGLTNRAAILKHGLRNAMIPVITVVGLRFGGLLAGTVLVESVFSIPGIGRLMVDGVLHRDYPVVQGSVLFVATSFVLINMIVDIVYGLIDPRIRTS